MKPFSFVFTLALLLFACQTAPEPRQTAEWKEEIRQAEADFARMALDEGIGPAFLAFAADDAVLMRNNRLIEGRDAIREWFEGRPADPARVKLEWKPDFAEVSSSGDLGYTYGGYTLTITDSLGAEQVQTGVFHTVWKRQADGSWKFVWD